MASSSNAVDVVGSFDLETAKTFDNCEWMLDKAPKAIAVLGNLLLVATEKDFSLEGSIPANGFELLKYPKSFRACLMQIANLGFDAFNEAHVNMDIIRLHSQNIINMIPELIDKIKNEDMEIVENFVPIDMEEIKDISEDCVKVASNVSGKFDVVCKATAELLEASTGAKGAYEHKLHRTDIAINVAEIEKEHALKEKEELSKQLQDINKDIETAQNQFNEAIRKIPSTNELCRLALVGACSDFIRALPQVFVPKQTMSAAVYQGAQMARVQGARNSSDSQANARVYKFAEFLHRQIENIESVLSENGTELKTAEIDKIVAAKETLSILLRRLQDEEQTQVHKECTEIVNGAVKICDKIQEIANEMPLKPEKIKEIERQVDRLLQKSKSFLKDALKVIGGSSASVPSTQTGSYEQSGSSNLVKARLEASRMRIDATREVLQETRMRQQQKLDEMKKSGHRLEETLKDLATLDMEKIDFQKIRETLIKGLRAMVEVREQWIHLLSFFQLLSNIVKVEFHRTTTKFLKYSEKSKTMRLRDAWSDGVRRMIDNQAFQATKVAHLVQAVSSAYVEVSQKHLINRITSLGGLLNLDPSTDRESIREKRNEIFESCAEAQREIERISAQRRHAFMQSIDGRLKSIEGTNLKAEKRKRSDDE